ncbi:MULTISPECIES: Co2+/Mg2+ efflux protein ApaG [Gluconobacter]|uniref:Protein ApaG n=3 Tax=Gluconobacter TaxID=441 RepID=A0A149T0I6_9PROT|nr:MULTISPECIES: Co2+/Mg2+ efflux protein ApaG [Gluconobacter]AQS90003.1 Co2+/Mg2+ efflux protein ApaG [Gluconobacter albidus]KXV37871.1 magnesium transporter [Gluconobacter albidus]KXV47229.1 magnesium transporter [Gluconobacter albidus]MBF0887991.1 Co2+/Mg2+ efflux protein ApaG [Gluconobacter cadivus]MBF0890241.1 Co2+/Mg2+ efflux protein ApaG [Gluconobacter cadivus]
MPDKSSHPLLHADPETALAEAMETAPCFSKTTDDVTVTVRTFWLDDQSHPEDHQYAWAYHISIENERKDTFQLLSRSWEIVDGLGRKEHVHGDGVVGEQPVIAPQEQFDYTSGAMLTTPSGFMHGTYHMLEPRSGHRFDVSIPVFSLDSPHDSTLIH